MRRFHMASCLVALCLLVLSAPLQTFRRSDDFRRFEPFHLLFSAEQNQQLDALLANTNPELLPLYKQLFTEFLAVWRERDGLATQPVT